MTRIHPLATPIALSLALAACGGHTGGSYLSVPITVGAQAPAAEPNAKGWTVRLTRAELNMGPLRLYEGEPLFARLAQDALGLLLGGRSAFAHPGHYEEGAALAEWLQPQVIDLLSPSPVLLGEADAVTGAYRSAQLDLNPSPALSGAVLVLQGTADRDGISRSFSATASTAISVQGIAAYADVQGAADINLTVDLGTWVENIDFELLGASGTLVPETQPHNALMRGVFNTSAYAFVISTDAAPQE